MKFAIGQKVRFTGGMYPKDAYHEDYRQLLEQVGTVTDNTGILFPYEAEFDGFTDTSGDKRFVCAENELESVE